MTVVALALREPLARGQLRGAPWPLVDTLCGGDATPPLRLEQGVLESLQARGAPA